MKKRDEKINAVYNYIRSFITDNGYPPSVREICSALGIRSTASAQEYIDKLVDDGLVVKSENKKRSINLRAKCGYVAAPLIGKVTAGEPILAVENLEGYYPLPAEFGSEVFMLSVEGESMIEAGIMDGDKIIVRQQQTANNGDIVVAYFDEKATVKRFYKKEDHFILHPENSAMSDIIVNEVSVLGKVVGLIRKI